MSIETAVSRLGEIMRNFVMKIFTGVPDLLMEQRDFMAGFNPVKRTFALAGQVLLHPAQFPQCLLERARIGNGFAVRQRGEIRQANVNARAQASGGQRRALLNFARQLSVPARGAARDGQLLRNM